MYGGKFVRWCDVVNEWFIGYAGVFFNETMEFYDKKFTYWNKD